MSFFETALELALNGFHVYMCDVGGSALPAGLKGISTQDMLANIGCMLKQIERTELPLFMMSHSTGCQVLESFLRAN